MAEKIPSVIRIALLKLLKPLTRLLIKQEISHSEFSEIARQAYVESSYDYFELPGRDMTISRVSVLTGLSRKEVVRLSKGGETAPKPKLTQNRASRVAIGWSTDPIYVDENGDPKPLAFKGVPNSFADLSEKYGGDVPIATILDEMILKGIVKRDEYNRLILVSNGYVPSEDELENIKNLLVCSSDLLSTGVHNLNEDDKDNRRFQRQIYRANVPESIIKEFKVYHEARSQKLMMEYIEWLRNKAKDYDESAKESTKQIGIGHYYLENEE